MASKIAEAYAEIRTDTTKFDRGMRGVRTSAVKTQAVLTGMKTAALGAMGALGIGLSVAGFAGMVKSAAEAEKQIKRFEFALDAAGASTEASHQEISRAVEALKEMYAIDDDVIRETMTLGLNMGITADQIVAATEAAIGLSEVSGQDLNSSMALVTKGLHGNFTAVGKLIPAIKTLTTDEEKLAYLQNLSATGLEQRKQSMDSVSGGFDRLGIAAEDLGKTIGGNIAEFIHLDEILNYLGESIEWLNGVIGDGDDELKAAGNNGQKALHKIKDAADKGKPSILQFFEANAAGARGMAGELESAAKKQDELAAKVKKRNADAQAMEQNVRDKQRGNAELAKARQDKINKEQMGPDAKRRNAQRRGSAVADAEGDWLSAMGLKIDPAYIQTLVKNVMGEARLQSAIQRALAEQAIADLANPSRVRGRRQVDEAIGRINASIPGLNLPTPGGIIDKTISVAVQRTADILGRIERDGLKTKAVYN